MHTFVTEVSGASFHQNPGVLIQGEDVILERVPTNKVYSNAISVLDKYGVRAGWIPCKFWSQHLRINMCNHLIYGINS